MRVIRAFSHIRPFKSLARLARHLSVAPAPPQPGTPLAPGSTPWAAFSAHPELLAFVKTQCAHLKPAALHLVLGTAAERAVSFLYFSF